MNTNDIATKADLENLLAEIKKLLPTVAPQQKFLRSSDVRDILNISDGTLQRLRENKILAANKVGGTWYYKYDDVIKMIDHVR